MFEDSGEPKSVVVHGATATATAQGFAPTLLMTTPFWWYWLENAVDAQSRAWAARGGAISGTQELGNALIDETRESMMAVTAAAHAIEAFAILRKKEFRMAKQLLMAIGRLEKEAQPRKKKPKGGRHLGFIEELEEASGAWLGPWEADVGRVFNLRDRSSHYVESPEETTLHPVGTSVSADQVRYRAETASNAAAVALQFVYEVLGVEAQGGSETAEQRRTLMLGTVRRALSPLTPGATP